MELKERFTLGRSGLVVSPLCLGTMTFGNKGWGSADDVSAAIFNGFLEAGGNFVDTADVYSGGKSEELVGKLIAERGVRDDVVLATKWSFAGGNGRKNMHRALEGSLGRLGTDYVDLYWMHVWDGVTPAEEVLESLGNLVRAGKIRYFGLSDCPAWFATRMCTLAEIHGVPGPIALQLPYALTDREIENEHVPAARRLGMGLAPWSPLAGGFLTGKYTRDEQGKPQTGGGRLDLANQPFRKFTERNWRILDGLREVASEIGEPPAKVALAWVRQMPGVVSTILGASTVSQLNANVESLGLTLSAEQMGKLTAVSAMEPGYYELFKPGVQKGIFKGVEVKGF